MNEKQYGIEEVAQIAGLTVGYVRRAIQKGKLATSKVTIANNTFKHFVSETELNRWRATSETRTQRNDGRNKYTLYGTPAEVAKLMKLIEANKLETPIKRSNVKAHKPR